LTNENNRLLALISTLNATISALRAVPVQQPIQTFTPIEVRNFGTSSSISANTNLISSPTAITRNEVAVLPPSSSVISSPVPSFAVTPVSAPRVVTVSPNVIAAPSVTISVPAPFQTAIKGTNVKGTNVKGTSSKGTNQQ